MKRATAVVYLINILTGTAMAGTMGSTTQQPDLTWIGTFSAGPAWGSGGKTQTFYLAPEIVKTYAANQPTNTFFNGEFFVGLQRKLSQMLQGQLGMAVAATSNTSLSGAIWDDADPQFDNYTYGYKLQHTHVAVKGKILADAGYWLIPWVSASLGVGFNDAYAFNNTPTISEALPNPNFASHTQTAFSYTLGAGVQKALNKHWQVGVGYEFADWGRSQLGRAAGQTLNSGLSLNHYYTNGMLFNMTYIL